MREASTALPTSAQAAAQARIFCQQTVESWWPDSSDAVLADALLIVSELVTNAVRADASHIELALQGDAGTLRIGVSDDAAGEVSVLQPAMSSPHGRGLMIVAGIARAWGTSPVPRGKQVWADLALPAS